MALKCRHLDISVRQLLSLIVAVVIFGSLTSYHSSFAQTEIAAASVEHNGIVKWCENTSGKVRYTTPNIQVAKYSPCGSLSVQKTCDAVGTKYFSKSGKAPYGFLDCGKGPRIIIETSMDPDEMAVESRELARAYPASQGYSSRPNNRATQVGRSYKDVLQSLDQLLNQNAPASSSKRHGKNIDLEAMISRLGNLRAGSISLDNLGDLQKLVGNFLPGGSSGKGFGGLDLSNPKQMKEQFKGLLKQLDPDSQQAIEDYFFR